MARLQKVIAESGYTSRRKAEELIKDGKVKVNNEVATLGMKVDSKDIISVNGKLIRREEKEYYLLNKPRGVISASSDDILLRFDSDLLMDDDNRCDEYDNLLEEIIYNKVKVIDGDYDG